MFPVAVEILAWAVAVLIGWRCLQLLGVFSAIAASELGWGAPAEVLGVEIEAAPPRYSVAGGVRPVSIVVPFAGGDPGSQLTATLGMVERIEAPPFELLVVTDVEAPADLPLDGAGRSFGERALRPSFESRLQAPEVMWEAEARGDERVRLIGIAGDAPWQPAALNVGANAARYPTLLWCPAGSEVHSALLLRLGKAILSRDDVACVAAASFTPPPTAAAEWTDLCADLATLCRLRTSAPSLGPLADDPLAGVVLWRRQALVDAKGLDHRQADALAGLERRLRRGGTDGAPRRSLTLVDTDVRRRRARSFRELVADEVDLLCRRLPRALHAEGARAAGPLVLLTLTDRFQPLLETVTWLVLIVAGVLCVSATDVAAAWSELEALATAAAAALILAPFLLDLFVLLADQVRCRRWSDGLWRMASACALRATLVRPLVAALVWPTVVARRTARLFADRGRVR